MQAVENRRKAHLRTLRNQSIEARSNFMAEEAAAGLAPTFQHRPPKGQGAKDFYDLVGSVEGEGTEEAGAGGDEGGATAAGAAAAGAAAAGASAALDVDEDLDDLLLAHHP